MQQYPRTEAAEAETREDPASSTLLETAEDRGPLAAELREDDRMLTDDAEKLREDDLEDWRDELRDDRREPVEPLDPPLVPDADSSHPCISNAQGECWHSPVVTLQ